MVKSMSQDDYDNGSKKGGIQDIMKKALSAGIGALFLTEESLRSYVADSKLPRDIAKSVIQSTNTAKEQFFQYLTKEVSQLIRKADLQKVVTGFLANHTFEIEARVRFRPNGKVDVETASLRAASGETEEVTLDDESPAEAVVDEADPATD